MTLRELSRQYRLSAGQLKIRINELDEQNETISDPQERIIIGRRLTMLRAMWRETRDIAVLLERYYERGYRRNARYTL